MTTIQTAKDIIDAHADAVARLIAHVETTSMQGGALDAGFAAMKPLALSQIEAMAAVEKALHASLTKSDLGTAKEYAETKLRPLRERAFRELPKLGLNSTFTAADVAAVMARAAARPVDALGRKLSYATGFIVCHRKCCQNDAGNGVAVGVGCYDCSDNVESESCPPM